MHRIAVIAVGVFVSIASASSPATQPARLTPQQLQGMTKNDLIKTILELQREVAALEESARRLKGDNVGIGSSPDDSSPPAAAESPLQIVAFKIVDKQIPGASGPGRIIYMGEYKISNTGSKPATGFKATVEIVDEFGDVINTQKWKEVLALPVKRVVPFEYGLGSAFAFDRLVKGDIHKLKARFKDVTLVD